MFAALAAMPTRTGGYINPGGGPPGPADSVRIYFGIQLWICSSTWKNSIEALDFYTKFLGLENAESRYSNIPLGS